MKNKLFTIIALGALILTLGACKKGTTPTPAATDPNTGEIFSIVGDQVGRPGIATVFIGASEKDDFNQTIPSLMGPVYQPIIQTQLQAYNGGNYVSNILGLNAAAFSGVLGTDVLNVSTTGTTTYYNGTNVLTGRALTDDVITTSLTLIFGGPSGTANPNLTTDHVPANDKPFLAAFPYEAAPW